MVTSIRPRASSKKRTNKQKTARLKCLVVPLRTDKLALILAATKQIQLKAYWFDVRGEGQAIGVKPFVVNPGSTLYFVASPYTVPNHPEYRYFYILQHSDEQGRFACSCVKGWCFKQTQTACEHMQFMDERGPQPLEEVSSVENNANEAQERIHL